MKKLLKKSILASVAVLAVSAALTMSAFADGLAAKADYASEGNKLTVTISGANDGDQLTILVLNKDATTVVEQDIVYINQDPAANGGKTYEIQLPDLDDGTYFVRVGSSDPAVTFVTDEFTIGTVTPISNYTIGNVNGDVKDGKQVINATDATHILQMYVGLRNGRGFEEGIPDEVGDVDENKVVNATDASQVLQAAVGIRHLNVEAEQFKRKDITVKVTKQSKEQ